MARGGSAATESFLHGRAMPGGTSGGCTPGPAAPPSPRPTPSTFSPPTATRPTSALVPAARAIVVEDLMLDGPDELCAEVEPFLSWPSGWCRLRRRPESAGGRGRCGGYRGVVARGLDARSWSRACTTKGSCPRCGAARGEGSAEGLAEEEGYRRGFQQGMAYALFHAGIDPDTCLLGHAVTEWRHDRVSIGRRVVNEAAGRLRTEIPPTQAECRGHRRPSHRA